MAAVRLQSGKEQPLLTACPPGSRWAPPAGRHAPGKHAGGSRLATVPHTAAWYRRLQIQHRQIYAPRMHRRSNADRAQRRYLHPLAQCTHAAYLASFTLSAIELALFAPRSSVYSRRGFQPCDDNTHCQAPDDNERKGLPLSWL